jgi:serine/threonine protein kinase
MSLVGKVLQNRYAVEKQIGEGGMGTVYLATDRRFGTKVAIKQTLFTDPNLLRAFEREAQLLNSLRHPALPRVSDHFADADGAFIVMEYIAGEDLSAMVERDGAFAAPDVLRWAGVLLDALDYLHTQKTAIVHRDIKPQNLKLTPRGEIILLDFGLAKGTVSELTQASVAKSVFGYSRAYAPLEQIQGTGTDPRSDLYSLAATLYHLFTGKPPVDALTRATAVLNGDKDPLVPAHVLNPKVSVAVSSVLHQAMALNSNLRPANAAKMRFALVDAEKNAAAEEFFDGATIVRSAEVFNQNTQLMNADGAVATNIAAQKITDPQPVQNTLKIDTATSVAKNLLAAKKNSFIKSPVKMAASILVFGSIGFASWYGIKPLFFADESNQIQRVNAVADVQTDAKPTEQQQANLQAAPANPAPTTETTQKAEIETVVAAPAPKTDETAKTNAPKQKPQSSERRDVVVENADDSWERLENLDAEVERKIKSVDSRGVDLNDIPAEIRSDDPRNPIDRRKLREYIRKQRRAVRLQIEEANKHHAEQGLPPLKPVPPKIKRPPQPQPDDDDDDEN